MTATHIHDLALIVEDLERSGRLTRIAGSVDPKHDLAGIAAKLEGGPRAVLFENVAGHEWPVLTGLYWSREMLADLLRREERTLPQYVSDRIRSWQQAPVDPVVVPSGPVLEVTEPNVDMARIPVPVHAEKDGGPYFDAAVVIAKDPETGVRNASIQRFQVVAKDRLHVNIDAGRHLELYLEKAEARGETLTFTLNSGVGPGLHFAAAAPAEAAPADMDELGIASAFHGAPLELVKASNGHDDMVAHAMWALECEIVPGEVADEGPFAEVTGYYATVAPRPVVHVRRIHRRASPVFQTILSGIEVWNSVGLLGEANILQLLQKQVPGVVDVYMSHGGGGFYHCIVQLAQKRQGWSKQAILAAFSAFPPLKMVTVVDDDVDLRSAQDVEWAMATRLDPKKGIVTIEESFGHGLNPSFPDYLGPKVGFDATRPWPPTWAYERATYKPMSLEAVEMVQPEIVRRPAPTDTAQTGAAPAGPSRAGADADEAALARPQPIDLTPVRPRGDRDAIGAAAGSEDPDAWIARPAPIDLAPRRAADPPAPAVADPDAWIVRPAPIDLGPVRARAVPAAAAADDPDAWIARPAPIDLTPVGAPAAAAGGEPAARPAAQAAADPDAWIVRPAPADLDPPATRPSRVAPSAQKRKAAKGKAAQKKATKGRPATGKRTSRAANGSGAPAAGGDSAVQAGAFFDGPSRPAARRTAKPASAAKAESIGAGEQAVPSGRTAAARKPGSFFSDD